MSSKPLTYEEISVWKELFDEYDVDQGGNISSEEFGRVMKQHDPKVTDAEVAQIVREVDLDGDGTINFGEFISMMTGRTKMPELAPEPEPVELPTEPEPKRNVTEPDSAIVEDSEADFKAAWKEFDPSLKSSITASQLRQLVANMGETISDEEVDGIVNSIDDEDRIIYKEFADFMRGRIEEDIIGGYE